MTEPSQLVTIQGATEATFSANFRLVLANSNLPVNMTFRADHTASSEEFVGALTDLIAHMLTSGWNTREASLGPNQDIQEASAYIVGRSNQGARIVHLFKPPLSKRTGYVYEELFDKLPFKLTGSEKEYPTPGVNPQLPRDEQYLNKLPGTFQFIRTAQPAKEGAMAAKRYSSIYFVPASMQIEIGNDLETETLHVPPPPGANAAPPPATERKEPYEPAASPQQVNEFKQLCRALFGDADTEEVAAFLTWRYTNAIKPELRLHGVTDNPTHLSTGQIAFIHQTVGNNSGRYIADWERHKLGWISRNQQKTSSNA